MASPQAEAIKEQLRVFAGALDPNASLDDMRSSYETFSSLTGDPAATNTANRAASELDQVARSRRIFNPSSTTCAPSSNAASRSPSSASRRARDLTEAVRGARDELAEARQQRDVLAERARRSKPTWRH